MAQELILVIKIKIKEHIQEVGIIWKSTTNKTIVPFKLIAIQ